MAYARLQPWKGYSARLLRNVKKHILPVVIIVFLRLFSVARKGVKMTARRSSQVRYSVWELLVMAEAEFLRRKGPRECLQVRRNLVRCSNDRDNAKRRDLL